MLPGFEDQERIFINKFVYRSGPSIAATLWYSIIRVM